MRQRLQVRRTSGGVKSGDVHYFGQSRNGRSHDDDLAVYGRKTAKEQTHEVVLGLGTKPSRWREQVWLINILGVNLALLKELLAPVVAVSSWEGGGQAKAVAMGRT